MSKPYKKPIAEKRALRKLRRMGYSDQTGDYGYKGKYSKKPCYNIKDHEEKVKCADEKYNSEGGRKGKNLEEETKYRKNFALKDIEEGCSDGHLCYTKDEEGIPRMPNEICVKHEKCGPPGVSLYDIYRDFVDYYKDVKDLFNNIKRDKRNPTSMKKRSASVEKKRRIKMEEIESKMDKIIKEYNSVPYPGSDSFSSSTMSSSYNSDSVPLEDGYNQIGNFKKLLIFNKSKKKNLINI